MQVDVILCGLGRMGHHHFRILQESAWFRLRGVVDPNVTQAELSGVPVFADVEAVPVSAYRAAVVATPTETHHGLGKTLLSRGKHLLLEKPFASTAAECRELTELARSAGVRLAVGHVERFNPVVQRVFELVRGGQIGTPVHFTFTRAGPYPEADRIGKNVLLDLAVHDLDLLRVLGGEATLVSSVAHATRNESVIDLAEMLLHTTSGATASVHVDWLSADKTRTLRVVGSRGVLVADLMQQTCALSLGQHTTELPVTRKEPLRGQLEAFHALLEGADTALCLPLAATRSVELAQQAMAMARSS